MIVLVFLLLLTASCGGSPKYYPGLQRPTSAAESLRRDLPLVSVDVKNFSVLLHKTVAKKGKITVGFGNQTYA
jgi:hypothetical protein